MSGIALIRPGGARGAGLLQAMVVLLVLATLCAIAWPDLQALLDRQRAASARHLLSSHLAFARMAAIRRQVEVSMCASRDGLQCAGADDWQHGWIIHLNRPEHAGPLAAEDVLHQHALYPPSGWRIRASQGRPFIRFLDNGRALGTNLSLWVCRNDQPFGRVVVNNSGRNRSERQGRKPDPCAQP